MVENRLNIISNSNEDTSSAISSFSKKAPKLEARAIFERMWLQEPEQFDPLRNCMERERLNRSWELIKDYLASPNPLFVDLGCAAGVFSRKLRDAGAKIHAVDIAANALKHLQEYDMTNIEAIQDYLPMTNLKDDTYDLVVATEVIAFLSHHDYRLFFAELSRLVKRDGHVLCSTPLDINSEDALQRFADLAETEFQFEKWRFSYHRLYIRVRDFFEAPVKFVKARSSNEYRIKELSQRRAFNKWWFKWNSTSIPASFWFLVKFLSSPLAEFINQNHTLMRFLEKICRFIWSDSGISHAIFTAKRRPLIEPPQENHIPIERKQKRQVWE